MNSNEYRTCWQALSSEPLATQLVDTGRHTFMPSISTGATEFDWIRRPAVQGSLSCAARQYQANV
jgi:hypothetical protein